MYHFYFIVLSFLLVDILSAQETPAFIQGQVHIVDNTEPSYHPEYELGAALSADSSIFAFSDLVQNIYIFDLNSKKYLGHIKPYNELFGSYHDFCLNSNGTKLAVLHKKHAFPEFMQSQNTSLIDKLAAFEGILVYDLSTLSENHVHNNPVTSRIPTVSYSPRDRSLILSKEQEELDDKEKTTETDADSKVIYNKTSIPNSRQAYSPFSFLPNGEEIILPMDTDERITRKVPFPGLLGCILSFNENSDKQPVILSTLWSNTIDRIRYPDGRNEVIPQAATAIIARVSHNGERIILMSAKGEYVLFDKKGSNHFELQNILAEQRVRLDYIGFRYAALSGDGRLLATNYSSFDPNNGKSHWGIAVRNSDNDDIIRRFNLEEFEPTSLVFSNDSKFLAVGTLSGFAYVWNVSSGDLVRKFSANDTSYAGTLVEFNIESNQLTIAFLGHRNTHAKIIQWDLYDDCQIDCYEVITELL